jgi:DNA-directed RNA polymerase specialized sigma24 family protein
MVGRLLPERVFSNEEHSMAAEEHPAHASTGYAKLAREIRAGSAGAEALEEVFGRGLRFYFSFHLGSHQVEGEVQQVLSDAVRGIRSGRLRIPSALRSFMLDLAARDRRRHPRSSQRLSPESSENVAAARQALGDLSDLDREILIRFYAKGELPKEICEALRISQDEFRRRKAAAMTIVSGKVNSSSPST